MKERKKDLILKTAGSEMTFVIIEMTEWRSEGVGGGGRLHTSIISEALMRDISIWYCPGTHCVLVVSVSAILKVALCGQPASEIEKVHTNPHLPPLSLSPSLSPSLSLSHSTKWCFLKRALMLSDMSKVGGY